MSVGVLLGVTLPLGLLVALTHLTWAAVDRVGRVRAHQLAQEGRRGATALLAIVEDPGPPSNALHLVRLGATAGVAGAASLWSVSRWDGLGALVAAAGVVALLYVMGVLLPWMLGVQRSEAIALAVSPALRGITRVLTPVTAVAVSIANLGAITLRGVRMPKGPFVSDEEIRNVQDEVVEEEIEQDERELIHSIFEFGDTIVREVMVPRTDMVCMSTDARLTDALEVIIEAGYSRIPIYDGDLDNVVGVLYAKDLMRRMHETSESGGRVGSLGRAPTFVPEQKRLTELLREMQTEHVHMAIVVDEYGGTAGLVTIEDLIEEIVGEIVDEFDREEPLVEPIDQATIRVDAKMPIDEVNELLDVDLPHEEWDTVGGLVFGMSGRVPQPGDVVKLNGLSFMTERVTGRRIQKVVIRKSGGSM